MSIVGRSSIVISGRSRNKHHRNRSSVLRVTSLRSLIVELLTAFKSLNWQVFLLKLVNLPESAGVLEQT